MPHGAWLTPHGTRTFPSQPSPLVEMDQNGLAKEVRKNGCFPEPVRRWPPAALPASPGATSQRPASAGGKSTSAWRHPGGLQPARPARAPQLAAFQAALPGSRGEVSCGAGHLAA